MYKGIKFRAYPNKAQQELLDKNFGCCRFVYNYMLSMRKDVYISTGKKFNYNSTSKLLTELKQQPEYSYLNDADAVSLQQSLRDLDTAFNNFFDNHTKYPKLKCKRSNHQSYRTINQNGSVYIKGKYIKLPKIGMVKIKQSMSISNMRILNVVVEKVPTGKYYIILTVKFTPEPIQHNKSKIGIDMGIKHFYTDSNTNTVDNPVIQNKKYLTKVIREQRKLSRKQFGSNNYNKQRLRLARTYEKLKNVRTDFLQKESTKLIRENQTICIEDLKIKYLIRISYIPMYIVNSSWYMFFNMLEYKSLWYGNTLIKVPTMYPSSQICNCCGYQNSAVKNLSIRMWECPSCHAIHNRDINASINILNKGISQLKLDEI